MDKLFYGLGIITCLKYLNLLGNKWAISLIGAYIFVWISYSVIFKSLKKIISLMVSNQTNLNKPIFNNSTKGFNPNEFKESGGIVSN